MELMIVLLGERHLMLSLLPMTLERVWMWELGHGLLERGLLARDHDPHVPLYTWLIQFCLLRDLIFYKGADER